MSGGTDAPTSGGTDECARRAVAYVTEQAKDGMIITHFSWADQFTQHTMSPSDLLLSCCSIEECVQCCVEGNEMPFGPQTGTMRDIGCPPVWFAHPTYQVLCLGRDICGDLREVVLSDGAEWRKLKFVQDGHRREKKIEAGSLITLYKCVTMEDVPGIVIVEFSVVFPSQPLIGQPLDKLGRHHHLWNFPHGLHGSVVLKILKRARKHDGADTVALAGACFSVCADVGLFNIERSKLVPSLIENVLDLIKHLDTYNRDEPLLHGPSKVILSALAWHEQWIGFDGGSMDEVLEFVRRRSFDDLVGKLMRRKCGHCGRRGSLRESHFRQCDGCGCLRYCSISCQRAAWTEGHQHMCAKFAALKHAYTKEMDPDVSYEVQELFASAPDRRAVATFAEVCSSGDAKWASGLAQLAIGS